MSPYRARGLWTMIQRAGKWVRLKRHTSHEKAIAHSQALNIAMKDKE